MMCFGQAAKASAKAAGCRDSTMLAVTPKYVSGFEADRELAYHLAQHQRVAWKTSLVFFVARRFAAVRISPRGSFAPLLSLGGAYLWF